MKDNFNLLVVVAIILFIIGACYNFSIYQDCQKEHSKTYCYALVNGRAIVVDNK